MENTIILLVIFFTLLCGFYYVFYANPFRILDIARIPVMIICVSVLFFVLIFIEYYYSKVIFKEDSLQELWINFFRYSYKYLYYLLYFFTITIISYAIYKSIESGIVFSFNYSFFISIGLIFLLLAMVETSSKSSSTKTGTSDTLELLKAIIMYIPCLITDAIDYIKKDYENTPSTVFIVFLLTIVYIFFFYIMPFIRKQQYKNDGIILIEKASYLNTNILSMTTDELIDKIQKKRPFYDKWFQKVISRQEYIKPDSVDIRTPISDVSMNFRVPPDKITLPYYIRKIEGFNSIQNQDRLVIPYDLFKKRISENDDYKDTHKDENGLTYNQKYSPDAYKNSIKEYVESHPQVLTFLEKAQYMYSSVFASWEAIQSIPSYFLPESTKINIYNYHYSISCWVYLQEVQSNEVQRIYSYGSRPSLYYDPKTSSLFVATNFKRNDTKHREQILYKTKSILFQRWNFIVMNYKYGTLDLFINNNLVGTYPEVLERLDPHDLLLVGSSDNKNIGGICNMKYYELPLSVRKINNIYKTFHNKKIPL